MEIKMIVEKNKKYQDPKSVFIDKYEVKFEIRGLPIVVNMALYKERSGSYLFVVNYTQIINIIILGMEFLISKGQIVGEEQAAASV